MLTFLGAGRGCAGALTGPSTRHILPKNFEKTALRKGVGKFTVKMRGGHIYGNYCTDYRNTVVMFEGAHHVPQELCGLDGRAQGPEGDDCQRQRQAGVVQTGGLVDHHVDHH